MLQQLLQLLNQEPVARGKFRACYLLPENPAKCVKVYLPGRDPEALRKEAPRWQQWRRQVAFDQNLSDYRLMKRMERRLGRFYGCHLPRCEGFVETDLGPGLVQECFFEAGGTPAPTCGAFVAWNGVTEEVEVALRELRSFMHRHRILVKDLSLKNFVFVANDVEGGLTAKIIDGFGSAALLPFNSWIPPLAERSVDRKFEIIRRRMQRIENRRRAATG